ncbi:branched-chain amino acid ABC transporter permease [Rhodoplanes elegans]|uniref:Branched-chain amino acid ABC transporter permease n=1 Tax=Rhodoplanes elegans TaxID=29408 RepID=A0A327KT74_9BRAD|nr:branched-chain amino acid ABC transporter permease [Rhodoplanes elegans]MBK5960435.1 branched-chain amino acid ABC transporter permease [Rhodoplanes elegans]RAI42110.1 branched-chain amino acid ABC transporter permease [Rhodoplanes elegans]
MTATDLLRPLLVVAVFAVVPWLGVSNATLNFLVYMLIVALAAQGWNILGGFGGQYSFGHAAFFGTGAYATAILQVQLGVNAWVGLLCGVAAGVAVGLFIGFLSFRSGLRGSYFALVTLAFAEVFRVVANAVGFTGGAAGLLIRLDPGVATLQFADRRITCMLVLGFVGIGLVISTWLTRSRFGAHLIAVRENEQAAEALGVDPMRVKLGAIALSAALTALAGCLYAQYFLFVDATVAYGPWISVEALLAPLVGGAGTVFGPLIGALALHGLGEATKGIAGSVPGIDLVVFGVVLILVIAFLPGGLMGGLSRLAGRLRTTGRGRKPAVEA